MHAWTTTQHTREIMENLPTELLFTIVDLIGHDQLTLARCNRINKQWHNLTKARLYEHPTLHSFSTLKKFLKTVSTPEVIEYIEQHVSLSQRSDYFARRRLKNRKGQAASASTSAAAAAAAAASTSSDQAPRLPLGLHVKSVDLSMIPHRWESVQYETVIEIIQGCFWIEQLNLSDCSMLRDNAIQVVAELLGSQGRLWSLVLSGCTKISDQSIQALSTFAPRIENLELSGCDRITDASLQELSLTILSQTSPALKAVWKEDYGDENHDDEEDEEEEVRDEASWMQAGGGLIWVTRPLKSLDLSHCTRITDKGVQVLRKGATKLESLNLEGCYGILNGGDGMNGWEDLDNDVTDADEDDE